MVIIADHTTTREIMSRHTFPLQPSVQRHNVKQEENEITAGFGLWLAPDCASHVSPLRSSHKAVNLADNHVHRLGFSALAC